MYHKYRFCKPTYGKVITFDIVQQRIQTEWYKLSLKLGKDINIWDPLASVVLYVSLSIQFCSSFLTLVANKKLVL